MKHGRKKSIRSLYDRWLVEGNGASLMSRPKGQHRRKRWRLNVSVTSEAARITKVAKRMAYRLSKGEDPARMMSSRGSYFYEPKLRQRALRKAKRLQARFPRRPNEAQGGENG